MFNLLGRYSPQASFWHTLDPRSKMVLTVATIIALLSLSWKALIIPLIFVVALYLTSRLSLLLGWRVLCQFKWLLLIAGFANLGAVRWPIGLAVWQTVALAMVKLAACLLVATWLGFVTKPLALVDGLARFLQPLQRLLRLKMDLALFVVLIFRFIPELWEQAQQIALAQRLRGAKPGRSWYQDRQWVRSTLIPIFIAAIRSSAAVALALEARGYQNGQSRTAWDTVKYGYRDWIITGLACVSMIYFVCKW